MDTAQQFLEHYCTQNAKELNKMVDKILGQYGGIYQMDYDDFYSIAGQVIWEISQKYDGRQNFEGFLYSCLENKIQSEITRRNRYKRQSDRNSISIDMLIGEDKKITIGDLLVSDFDMEKEIWERTGIFTDERIEKYFHSLSGISRQILIMTASDVPVGEIRRRLHLSEKQYEDCFKEIKSYENISKLVTCDSDKSTEGGNTMETIISIRDKTRRDSYSVLSYIKKMKKNLIRTDYCLQRNSGQWSTDTRDELIATSLNDLDIPYTVLCQQEIEGQCTDWLIDGLQRLTTFFNFHENVFRLGNKIERYNIVYQESSFDADGNPVLENKICDIRGKYYKDLPLDVQEMFDDYQVMEVKHLNCTDEDIEYHLRRYNSSKPMNQAQNGITFIGKEFGVTIKKYTRGHEFFKNFGNYKQTERKNGTLERIVAESVMVINYLDDWKKKSKDLCWFLKNNATAEQFDKFEDILDRLSAVLTDKTKTMFTSRNSFIYFALFDRFANYNLEDKMFADFLSELQDTLHRKEIEGVSFDDLNGKSTKDKKVIADKLNLLENLMLDFLHLDKKDKTVSIRFKNAV